MPGEEDCWGAADGVGVGMPVGVAAPPEAEAHASAKRNSRMEQIDDATLNMSGVDGLLRSLSADPCRAWFAGIARMPLS